MSHFTQSADAGSATEKEPTTAKMTRSCFISTVSFLVGGNSALNGMLCQDVAAMRIGRQGLRPRELRLVPAGELRRRRGDRPRMRRRLPLPGHPERAHGLPPDGPQG